MLGRHREYVDTGTRGDRRGRWEAQGAPSERKWLRAIYISFLLVPSLSLSLSIFLSVLSGLLCRPTSVGSSVMHSVADAPVTHHLEKVLFRRRFSL